MQLLAQLKKFSNKFLIARAETEKLLKVKKQMELIIQAAVQQKIQIMVELKMSVAHLKEKYNNLLSEVERRHLDAKERHLNAEIEFSTLQFFMENRFAKKIPNS